MLAMGTPSARGWTAAALMAASLSRYETWPACVVLATLCGAQGLRGRPRDLAPGLALALTALAGPVLWMAWNAHAHGSPLHFLARVSTFRRAVGASALPLSEKLLTYPRALVTETPEAAVLGVAGVAGLFFSPRLRDRWLACALCVAATMVFLVAGDLGDGAPTHHPARALSPIWWALVGMGVDTAILAAASLNRTTRHLARGSLGAAALAWAICLPSRWRAAPGMTEAEERHTQVARGLDMRRRGVPSAIITPCAFEHFAVIAAWGQPERAVIMPASHTPPTTSCPVVEER
jgi:hypothetical protein